MESTMETLEDRMLKSLEALDQNEFQSFKSRLQLPVYLEGLQPLTKFRLETADRKDTVSLIMQAYPNNGVKITVNVLKKMNRNDLLKWFIPEDSSRIEPPEAQQSMKKNSSRIELPEARQNMKKRKRLVGGIIVGISVGVILTVISVMQGVMFHANLRHSSALTSRPADQGRTSLPNYSGNPESPHDIPHQQDLKYIQVEGTLRLRPDTKPRSITSILWANGPNKVAIWYEGYYGTFNEHTELDKETGMLVISNMIIEDSGVYSVKVNGRLLSKTYKVEVIKKVPKPLVTTDQECSPTINCCSLVCGVKRTSIHQLSGRLEEYDAMKDTGLVTYRWRLVRRDGRVEWETHNRNPERLFLTYKDSEHVSESFCEMKNQVSVMESDPFPFHFIGQSGGPCGPTGPCLRECLDKDLPYTPLAGGILELLPDNNSVLEPITGILWTMNTDSTMKNVAEWNASFGPNVNYNGTYGGRTALNKETGKLVINNMTKEDSGRHINAIHYYYHYYYPVVQNRQSISKSACILQKT